MRTCSTCGCSSLQSDAATAFYSSPGLRADPALLGELLYCKCLAKSRHYELSDPPYDMWWLQLQLYHKFYRVKIRTELSLQSLGLLASTHGSTKNVSRSPATASGNGNRKLCMAECLTTFGILLIHYFVAIRTKETSKPELGVEHS